MRNPQLQNFTKNLKATKLLRKVYCKALILFLPSSVNNPYQQELSRYLYAQGCQVISSNEGRILPILSIVFSRGKPDILHLHWTHTLIKSRTVLEIIIKGLRLIAEILFLKIINVRIIWTVHNISGHGSENNIIENLIHRLLSRLCNAIIVHCEYAKLAVERKYKIVEYYRKKICVIPHGNYIESYENIIDRKEAREIMGFVKNEIVFGFFGNIKAYKGIFDLIDAFKRLKEGRVRLLLVGKAENNYIEKQLRKIAEKDKRISLCLGFIPKDEIQIYINCMDVVVLPFKKVLTSGSVLLSMSYGKPVIAPVIGCIGEILESNNNFLYEPNNLKSLISAMKKSLRADLEKIGKQNFQLALKADWAISARMTAEVYKKILNKNAIKIFGY